MTHSFILSSTLSLKNFFPTWLLLAMLLTCDSIYAQGIVSGKITNAETGTPMSGATVRILNSKLGAVSGNDGAFRITRVPRGIHKVIASFIGFENYTIDSVVVPDNGTVVLNIKLLDKAVSSSVVEVTAERTLDNAAAMLALRQKSSNMSDGITRDDMHKLPDGDAAGSLKRVTGITIVDKKFVFVRGISDRYSNTLLNGSSLSSTEPDKKSFSFDLVPSEFLLNANVAKSYSPDLPGTFAGGTVELNTVDFPEHQSLRVSTSTMYNDNVTFRSSAFRTYNGGSIDWIASDDGTRNAPAGAPVDRNAMNSLIARAGNPDADEGAGAREWIALGKSFNDAVWKQGSVTVPLNSSMGISYADLYSVGSVDLGLVSAVNYGNTYEINNIRRAGLNGDGTTQFDYLGEQSTRAVELGGMLNLSARLDEAHKVSVKTLYNRGATDETVFLEGSYIPQVQDRRFYSSHYTQRSLSNILVNGDHQFFGREVDVDWRVGYSASTREEPDLRRLRYNRTLGNVNEEFRVAIPAVTPQGDGNLAGRFLSGLEDDVTNGSLNLNVPVGDSKIKLGVATEHRNRSFSARSFTIIQSRAILPDVETDVDLTLEPGELLKSENFRGDGFGISEETRLSDTYTAQEQLYAAFAMVDIPFVVHSEKMRVIVGVRVEDNVQRLESFNMQNQPMLVNLSTTDVLPAVNFIWLATDQINVRASASQTLSRPMLREFAPFAFYDFQQQARTQGNPDLIRPLIRNYDLRFDYFLNPGEVVSVSAFYKEFRHAIEQTIIPSENIALTYSNANGIAFNSGLEFEVRKNVRFMGSWADDLMLTANLTIVSSELTVTQGGLESTRKMWGQAPYTFNASLLYTNPSSGTMINFGYNTVGRRIIRVALEGAYSGLASSDPHVYELPRDVIDLSIIQPLSSVLEIRLSIGDILNQQLVWEQVGQQVATNLRGRNISFGIGYRFY